MKKSVDVLGLPVISISDGTEIGTSKALLINPAQGSVAAVLVDDGKWYLGAKLLPFASVTGIGEYALTIESGKNITTVTAAPDMEKLLEADVKIIGAKVLTKTGRIEGVITEITIDMTGKIVSCEIDNNGDIYQLPAQRVLTYGKDVVIILDKDVAIETVVEAVPAAPAEPEAAPAAASSPAKPPEAENASDDSGKKFEDKQRKYLLGKKASKKIETDSGVIIVDAGGEITEEVIQKAKLAGKFVELSMSI